MHVSRGFVLALISLSMLFALESAAAKSPQYRTGFAAWRAADGGFAGWTLEGVALTPAGELTLDPATAATETDPYAAGAYEGGNFYNAGSYLVGQATGPEVAADFAFTQAIASWNAETPAGTWVETLIRARIGTRWSKWYNLGVWAADGSAVSRHSVRLQGDADGFVAVDTFIAAKKVSASGFQVRVRLFGEGSTAPTLRSLSVATSTTPVRPGALAPGDPALWNRVLSLPECSQMVYPDGGEVWCSPTSTSMVLGYWNGDTGPCEPRVRATVEGVFDWVYDGHGNWPFNTAYAAAAGLEGYVARFESFAEAERWIAAGVPVVLSFAWKKSDLTGAAIPSSAGHLAVLVGFDANGNPVVNDPAAATDAEVTRTYDRAELESLWLEHSGGTVYLIYPEGRPVPAL